MHKGRFSTNIILDRIASENDPRAGTHWEDFARSEAIQNDPIKKQKVF